MMLQSGAALEHFDFGPALRLIVVLALVSTAATLGLLSLEPKLSPLFASGEKGTPFESWCAVVAMTTIVGGGLKLARGGVRAASALVLLGALVMVGFFRQAGFESWDFRSYENAGRLLAQGESLYGWTTGVSLGGTRYWYSPLLAVGFAGLERLSLPGVPSPAFLLWTAANFWSAALAALLFGQVLSACYGCAPKRAAAWSLVLWLTTPMLRTLVYSQVNAMVLALILGAVLLHRSRTGLAGLLLGTAILVKTSPVLLVALAALHRHTRLVVFAAIACSAIVLGTMAFTGAQPWLDFVAALPSVRSDGFFRDNSFASVLLATARVSGLPASPVLASIGIGLGWLVAVALFVLARKTRAAWPWRTEGMGGFERDLPLGLACMVLVAPLAWEHHWIWVALPAALALESIPFGSKHFWACALGAALIFLVPTFDVFPLAYHRLFGALLVLAAVAEIARSSRRP